MLDAQHHHTAHLGLLLCAIFACSAAQAEKRAFYSVMGPDGKMMIIPRDPEIQRAVPTAVAPQSKAEQPPATPATPATPASVRPPVTMVDGVSYLDTEYLEQHEFNVEGKKRFYALPDGLGGTQIVEREKGVNLSALRVEKPKQPLVVLAPNYQRLDAKTLQDLAGVTCFEPKQLQKLNELHDVAVDIWPRPNFEQNFAFVAVKLHEQVQQIHLMSYATTTKRPQYYWPLVMFLNEQGCVTEGVNQFLQTRVKATMLQQAALQGYLRVPEGSKYIVLTPLAETAELSDLTLSDRGQLRLTPVDLTSPP